jgi:hypothetical protein
MKLLFELFTVALIFLIFRNAVRHFMPKKAKMKSFSPESLRALRKFRQRYFGLLFLFIILFGSIIYYTLTSWNNLLLEDRLREYDMFLPVSNNSFWQPSLLGGLLFGSLCAFYLNRIRQKDGLSFYLEELQELAQGYQSFRTFKWIQYVSGFLLFAFLVYAPLSSGLALKKSSLERLGPWQAKETWEIQSIKKLENQNGPQLLINNQDSISLYRFEYSDSDLEQFVLNSKP